MGNKQSIKSHMDNSQRTGVFQLTNAKLKEIPEEIFRLIQLRTIDLSGNNIKQLQTSIGNFANLRTLILNNNSLISLPEELCNLGKLETLSLNNNCLEQMPNKLSNLRSLRTINLSNNRLTKFPITLVNLKQLDFIDLAKNLIKEVPDGVEHCQAVEINLNQNQIATLSMDLGKCPRLKVLRLDENCLALAQVTPLLENSSISLLTVEGNQFDNRQLREHPAYDQYMERFTATRKKF